LNKNVCNNVEHDNDMMVLIDNHLSQRSKDLNSAGSSGGSSHPTHVPCGIGTDLGKSFWEHVYNVREHNMD
jgi:hypothetical protein